MSDEAKPNRVEAVSGVNGRGEGFVHIALEFENKERVVLQATPAEARQISQQIAEAAEAADTDAYVVQFFTRRLNMTIEQTGAFLVEFRAWREISGGVKNRDQQDPHWRDMIRKKKGGK